MLIFLNDVIIYDVCVTSSTSKTFMKFWGTCFKFWLRPYSVIFYHHWFKKSIQKMNESKTLEIYLFYFPKNT